MTLPEVVSREEWLAARQQLLAREKELTRQRDMLNADRRRLPMVRIEKEYKFEGPQGAAGLPDLFEGSGQLIVQHVMFDPGLGRGLPVLHGQHGRVHPGAAGPPEGQGHQLRAGRPRPVRQDRCVPSEAHGWTFPWYSSNGSDFNYDFGVTLDPAIVSPEYNYRSQQEWARTDPDWLDLESTEVPGVSCFLRDGADVYHTYSTFARGTELVGGLTYPLLDLTALGRQEEWEEPKGRAGESREADPSFRS